MTQYNKVNVKLSNPQLDKLKSAVKNATEVTNFHWIWLVILMMRLICHTNYY